MATQDSDEIGANSWYLAYNLLIRHKLQRSQMVWMSHFHLIMSDMKRRSPLIPEGIVPEVLEVIRRNINGMSKSSHFFCADVVALVALVDCWIGLS